MKRAREKGKASKTHSPWKMAVMLQPFFQKESKEVDSEGNLTLSTVSK
jgi:hypothetical protein